MRRTWIERKRRQRKKCVDTVIHLSYSGSILLFQTRLRCCLPTSTAMELESNKGEEKKGTQNNGSLDFCVVLFLSWKRKGTLSVPRERGKDPAFALPNLSQHEVANLPLPNVKSSRQFCK
ncbi:hypothetical protein CDAR_616891 [Caerostris darwini]|uniref:Uncharacterized protein n=1 Tax=Caerostris darwini TaxID=1538125 RepID=A0AAV4S3R2_9ARAC|nr:hypothetical protein CDAR_616891 [Caerostris darwini]